MKDRKIITGDDGEPEWLCEHGVGHPVIIHHDWRDVHTCDGCCMDAQTIETFKKEWGKLLGMSNEEGKL